MRVRLLKRQKINMRSDVDLFCESCRFFKYIFNYIIFLGDEMSFIKGALVSYQVK